MFLNEKTILLLSPLNLCYKQLTFLIYFGQMLSQQLTTSKIVPLHQNLEVKPPLTMWNGILSNLNYLRIFGSPTYAHVPNELCKKLHPKSHKGIFIGYGEQEGIKGYILYNKIKRKYFTSQNVTFNEESILPILQTTTNTNSSPLQNTSTPYK